MNLTIHQIGYKEGIFQFDSNAYEEGKAIGVSINPLMKLDSEDSDLLSLQLTVEYDCEGRNVMKYGGVAVYRIPEVGSILSDLGTKTDIWSLAIPFFRGILCEKLKGTQIERFLLPSLPDKSISDIPVRSNQ